MNWLPWNWIIESWFWVGISTVKTYNHYKMRMNKKNLDPRNQLFLIARKILKWQQYKHHWKISILT